MNTLRRKLKRSIAEIRPVFLEAVLNYTVHVNTAATVERALGVAERYGFSFYDSLIVAAALETGCTTLYSEDLHHGQVIDGKLEIQNPFA